MRMRVPGLLAGCVLVAVLHATAWAIITPTFQVPDETVHFGYAQHVAERGALPEISNEFLPPRDLSATFSAVPWSVLGKPSWDPGAAKSLQSTLDSGLSSSDVRTGGGYASNNPPLYYTLAAAPYVVNDALGGDLLDAILLMRLLSALLAGATVAFVWLLLRELFPRTPWAWTTGALAVALQPLFGFVSGGVNNDNLLNACGAAFLYLAVRALRRPPSPREGLLVGLPVAAALLTKLSAYGLLAGLLLTLALLVLRADGRRRDALRAAAAALVVAIAPFVLYLAVAQRDAVSATGGLGVSESYYTIQSIREQLSYVWQFWLPQPSFLQEQFPTYPRYPLWEIYFQSFVGRFGWFQYGFSPGFYDRALQIYAAVGVLAVAGLWRGRRALRGQWEVLAAFVGTFGVVALMVNIAGYRYREQTGFNFEQARYLLPMAGLYGAVVAAAVRGAGARWGPAAGVLLVVLAGGNAIAALLLTLNRYYL